jgi:hypothetical protein
MVSLKIIYFIPFGFLMLLNGLFLGFIFILRIIGKATVWMNNKISDGGNYFGNLANTDDRIDILLEKVKQKKKLRDIRKKNRRN